MTIVPCLLLVLHYLVSSSTLGEPLITKNVASTLKEVEGELRKKENSQGSFFIQFRKQQILENQIGTLC